MSQELWRAVCADPDDDTPRLAFADWCAENGEDDRAEFIRAQIELARTDPWTERAVELSVRERQLLQEHRKAWAKELPKWVNPRAVEYRRGFPYGIYLNAREYVSKRAGPLAKTTAVQQLVVNNLDMEAAVKLAAVPQLSRLRGFQAVSGSWAAWAAVLASPHLTGLRELWLHDYDTLSAFPHSEFRDVLRLSAVRPVERLDLLTTTREEDATAEILRNLADAPLTGLRDLSVTFGELRPQWLAGILKAPNAAGLRALRVRSLLNDHTLGGFIDAPERPALKSLQFSVYLSQDRLPEVFRSRVCRHLAVLDIEGMRGEGLRALAASPIAEQLRVLHLPSGYSEPGAWRDVLRSGRFRDLAELRWDPLESTCRHASLSIL